jgi:hypothetical protein
MGGRVTNEYRRPSEERTIQSLQRAQPAVVNLGLPFLSHAWGCRHGSIRRVRMACSAGYPIWHGLGAACAGFLCRCYSRPFPTAPATPPSTGVRTACSHALLKERSNDSRRNRSDDLSRTEIAALIPTETDSPGESARVEDNPWHPDPPVVRPKNWTGA